MKKTLLAFVTFIILHAFAAAHPFYVSVTQIDLKDGSLQITVKLFADDLQEALLAEGAPELFLGEEKELKTSDGFIHKYLDQNLSIAIDGQMINYHFVGKELEDGAVWVYLEITGVKNVKTVEVHNSLLTSQFASQKNMVHTNINGQQKSLILDKETKKETLTF